jgi:hypothetical protein
LRTKKIKFLHSCKKFGGIRIKPNVAIAGLIGQGAKILPIVIIPDEAVKTNEVMTPSVKRIWSCKISANLKNISNASRENAPPLGSQYKNHQKSDNQSRRKCGQGNNQ